MVLKFPRLHGLRNICKIPVFFSVICGLLFISIASNGLLANDSQPEGNSIKKQLLAFESFLQELETHYGMIKYKRETFGTTYEGIRQKYTHLIKTATTLEENAGFVPRVKRKLLPWNEFEQLMVGLASEFRDGHVNSGKGSDDFWTVGLSTAVVDGKLYVSGFNRDFYLVSTNPALKVWDEILEVDGRPVQELALLNQFYAQTATYTATQREAMESILNISGKYYRDVKAGDAVSIKFKRVHKDGKEHIFEGRFFWVNDKDLQNTRDLLDHNSYEIEDESEPYVYGNYYTKRSYFSEGLKRNKSIQASVIDIGKLLNAEIEEAYSKAFEEEIKLDPKHAKERLLRKLKDAESNDIDFEQDNTAFPTAEPSPNYLYLKPTQRLHVYTFRYSGKTFGVIRIPDYSPPTMGALVAELKWLSAAVKLLQNSTDALIIDQLTNAGGFTYGVTQFVKLFAGHQDLKAVTIDLKLNKTLLRHNDILLKRKQNADSGRHATANFFDSANTSFSKNFLSRLPIEKLRKMYEEGNQWSGPIPTMGNTAEWQTGEYGRILGRKVYSYTKPIIVLNDCRSVSGGDFAPAILQANKRALIFGETSGALGGPKFRGQDSMPGSEMSFSCTMGYCQRSDGLPIENLGVVPDVSRYISFHDLKDNFKQYALDAVTAALMHFKKKDAKEIQTHINSEQKKFLPKVPATAELIQIRKMVQKIKSESKNEDKVIQSYQNFFNLLNSLTSESVRDLLTEDQWKSILFPLPMTLLKTDVLLSSLRTRDEVVSRLKQMLRLDHYKQSKQTIRLITLLLIEIEGLGEVRFNPCTLMLHRNNQ